MCLRRLVPPKHHGHHRHPRLRHKDAHRHRQTHGTVVQSLMSMLILIRTPVQLPMQILLFMLMRVTSFMLEFLQILPQIPVHRMLVVPMAFCLCSRLCRCTSLYPRLWCLWFLRCFCYILVLAVPIGASVHANACCHSTKSRAWPMSPIGIGVRISIRLSIRISMWLCTKIIMIFERGLQQAEQVIQT